MIMEFINRNISNVFKIMLAIVAVIILIKAIPLLIFVGAVVYGGNKLLNYIRKRKSEKVSQTERNNIKSKVYEEENYYDLSSKKIIDVEYEEIKRN